MLKQSGIMLIRWLFSDVGGSVRHKYSFVLNQSEDNTWQDPTMEVLHSQQRIFQADEKLSFLLRLDIYTYLVTFIKTLYLCFYIIMPANSEFALHGIGFWGPPLYASMHIPLSH